MKKVLAILTASLALASARADLIYFEQFPYSDGNILTTGSPNWVRDSGSGNDALVHSHRLEVSATGGTLTRQDDVSRPFVAPYTNSLTLLYASFIVNVTNISSVPANGGYFAHFQFGASTFYARIFAIPGTLTNTYRLGVSASSGSTAPNKVFPADLATNTDYQVVVSYDPVSLLAATMWINPVSSSDVNVVTSDAVTGTQQKLTGFGFRQAGTFGNFFCTISNLATATTYDEATTNASPTNAVSPNVVYSPKGGTNFVGDNVTLAGVANGQGLGSLTYTWLKDGSPVSNPNGNTNVFPLSNVQVSDTGNYALAVTTPYGLSATSVVAFLWVTNAPVPPTITVEPVGGFVYPHQTKTLTVAATGPQPISYQWYFNNSAASDNANLIGTGTSTLQITDITADDGTVGNYYCNVGNTFGNTNTATVLVAVSNVPTVSVAYLRTLVDPTTYTSTNLSLVYNTIGTVTTYTNITTGNTASYYLQDSTGCGINIFATLASTFRPGQGDVISFTGVLSTFNGNLELGADPGNQATGYSVLSNNIAGLPAAKVVPMTISNNVPLMETNLVGSIVMLTNVYFTTNVVFTNGSATATSVLVTNGSGQSFAVNFNTIDQDTAGRALPPFAWSVVGVMQQNATNSGYSVEVTRFSDIVTDAPPAVTASVARNGNNATISWTDVTHDPLNFSYGSNYSYSVLSAPIVSGPYTPLKTGLTFTNPAASYTDSSASGSQTFYRVVSP
jgi:hypothetical protein